MLTDVPDRARPARLALPDAPDLEHDDRSTTMCQPCSHTPTCPSAAAPDHDAARVISRHPEQGWILLCNGVVVFDDTGEILPDGRAVAPHRPACRVWVPAA